MVLEGLSGLSGLDDEAEAVVARVAGCGLDLLVRVEGVRDPLVDPVDGKGLVNLGPQGLVDRVYGGLE